MKVNYLLSPEKRKRVCDYYSQNLKALGKLMGMNQTELAMAVGTTQRHVSEIENGKAEISWTLMLALSTIFVMQEKNGEDNRVMEEDLVDLAESRSELAKILQEVSMCGRMVELSATNE